MHALLMGRQKPTAGAATIERPMGMLMLTVAAT